MFTQPITWRYSGQGTIPDTKHLDQRARVLADRALRSMQMFKLGRYVQWEQIPGVGFLLVTVLHNGFGAPLVTADLTYTPPEIPSIEVPVTTYVPGLFLAYDRYIIEPNPALDIRAGTQVMQIGNWRVFDGADYVHEGLYLPGLNTIPEEGSTDPTWVRNVFFDTDDFPHVVGYGGKILAPFPDPEIGGIYPKFAISHRAVWTNAGGSDIKLEVSEFAGETYNLNSWRWNNSAGEWEKPGGRISSPYLDGSLYAYHNLLPGGATFQVCWGSSAIIEQQTFDDDAGWSEPEVIYSGDLYTAWTPGVGECVPWDWGRYFPEYNVCWDRSSKRGEFFGNEAANDETFKFWVGGSSYTSDAHDRANAFFPANPVNEWPGWPEGWPISSVTVDNTFIFVTFRCQLNVIIDPEDCSLQLWGYYGPTDTLTELTGLLDLPAIRKGVYGHLTTYWNYWAGFSYPLGLYAWGTEGNTDQIRIIAFRALAEYATQVDLT